MTTIEGTTGAETGTTEIDERETLAYWFAQFADERLTLASESTCYQYQLNLRRFEQRLKRQALLADLTEGNVLKTAAWMMKERGLAAGSAAKLRDNFQTVWVFMAKRGVVPRWPELPTIPEPKRIPRAWTREQLLQLWSTLKRWPGELSGIPAAEWMCAFHATIWSTGERVGPILLLRWSDVDLAGGWMVTRAETRKGRMADKLHKLHVPTIALLKRIQAPNRDLVFPWPYQREYLWTKYGEILKAAGLPCDREHKFHCLRKSVATLVDLFGGDAQRVMGHTTNTMTEANYIDPRISPRPQAVDVLPWFFDEAQ